MARFFVDRATVKREAVRISYFVMGSRFSTTLYRVLLRVQEKRAKREKNQTTRERFFSKKKTESVGTNAQRR